MNLETQINKTNTNPETPTTPTPTHKSKIKKIYIFNLYVDKISKIKDILKTIKKMPKQSYRQFFYRTGDLYLPRKMVNFLNTYIAGSDKSRIYLNYWSIMHFLSGVLVYAAISQNWIYALIIHTLWEMWQMAIGMTKYRTIRGLVDILMDTAAFLAGFALMSHIDKTYLNNRKE